MCIKGLSSSPLSIEEAIRLQQALIPLVSFLGLPGDWGYNSELGKLTIQLKNIQLIVNSTLETRKPSSGD